MPSTLLALAAVSCTGGDLADAPAPEPTPGSDGRPDVVLVVIDTLRADHVGSYGGQRPTTPNLDALAADGRRYTRAFSHSGWTLPAMASLLTGKQPIEHGAIRGQQERHYGRIRADVPLLAEQLRGAGYRTGAFVNNVFLAAEFGFDRGFDRYDWATAAQDGHRAAQATVDAALGWLGASTSPSFLLVHAIEPHAYYEAAAPWRGTFGATSPEASRLVKPDRQGAGINGTLVLDPALLDEARRAYDEEILAADAALGTLLAGLRARPRWSSTLVIVTSDHGEEFMDHGGIDHGHQLHAELTRVPLVVAGPGVAPGVDERIVQHADVHGEILARVGLADGGGRGLGGAGREVAIAEGVLLGDPLAMITDGDLLVIAGLATHGWEAWKLDAQGSDLQRIPATDPRVAERGPELLRMLARARGTLAAGEPASEFSVTDAATLEQLRALGYVGG